MTERHSHTASTGAHAADLAAITEALGELEIDDIAAGSAVETVEEEDDAVELSAAAQLAALEEIDEEVEHAIEADAVRSEAYAAQEGAEITTEAPEVVATKTTKAKVAKTPALPRASRDISTLPAEAFVLSTTAPADLEANKTAVLSLRPTQVKIAEKFDNIIGALHAGRAPSTYIMQCFAALKEKSSVTQSDLVAMLRAASIKSGARSYSEGTARSQVGQIMALFNVLQIAVREKQSLTINPDSTYGAKLQALSA